MRMADTKFAGLYFDDYADSLEHGGYVFFHNVYPPELYFLLQWVAFQKILCYTDYEEVSTNPFIEIFTPQKGASRGMERMRNVTNPKDCIMREKRRDNQGYSAPERVLAKSNVAMC